MADGKMVHEKTSLDRFLYMLTSAGIVVGMGMTFKFYYDFSFPKKAWKPKLSCQLECI